MNVPPIIVRLKWPLAYAAGGFLAFLLFLYLTLPYDAIRERITFEARAQGLHVSLGDLGPGFFSVTAKRVELAKLAQGDETKPPEPLRLDSVSIRPSLFPLGVAVKADAFGGTVKAVLGGISDQAVRVSFADVDLSKGNLKGFSGIDLEGKVDGQLSLDLPATAPGANAREKVPNLAEASGSISFTLSRVTVKGGTVTVPMYGQMTPLDLPRLALGTVEGLARFEKGSGTVERLAGSGGDIDLQVSGTLKLARQLEYSEPNLAVKLKPSEELMKNGFIGMGISTLPPDPTAAGFRAVKVMGFLGSPQFVPGV